MPPLVLQLYIFLQYLHCATFFTSPFEFSLFIIVKCFQTKEVRLLTLGFFSYMFGIRRRDGLRVTNGGGVLLIFKRIKFVTFINTKIKVFSI